MRVRSGAASCAPRRDHIPFIRCSASRRITATYAMRAARWHCQSLTGGEIQWGATLEYLAAA
jgi:hypothetical protein